MRTGLRLSAISAAILFATSLAHAAPGDPFGGDDSGCFPPSKSVAKCEDGVAKAIKKYIKAVIKCHTKAADAAVKGTAFDEELCEFNPATGKGAKDKFHAAMDKLLSAGCGAQCTVTNAYPLQETFEDLLDGPVNARIYACPGTPFGGDDSGNVPSSEAIAKCEGAVAKAIGKYAQSILKCHAKAAKTAAFSEDLCESDTFTLKGAKEKYEAAIMPLFFSCPPCSVANAHSLRSLVESNLDCHNGDIYCAGTTPILCEENCPEPTTTTTTTSTTSTTTTSTTVPPPTTTLDTTTTTNPTVTTTTTTTITLDHFLMYGVISGPDGPVVTVEDRFGTETIDLGSLAAFGPPVNKNGEGITDPLTNQACYMLNNTPATGWIADTHDQFGDHTVTVGSSFVLCVPTERAPLSPAPLPVTRDHFKCYISGFLGNPGPFVSLSTAFESYSGYAAQDATVLCLPVDKNGEGILRPEDHLSCYLAPSLTNATYNTTIRNQFHESPLQFSSNFNLLCVPSTATFRKCGNGIVEPGEACDFPDQGQCSSGQICDDCAACASCPAATAIPPEGGTFDSSTAGASSLFQSCGPSTGPERLFEWTPSVSGYWQIETCEGINQSPETVVYIREGTCNNFGSELACNDNGGTQDCGVGSRLTAFVTAGQTYTIFVEGGDFTLNVFRCGDGVCGANETPCSCPDDCPNDPNACEGCECSGLSENCACDYLCAAFGDCCDNVWSGVCCGSGEGPNGVCDGSETKCNCSADCANDPSACDDFCECGAAPDPNLNPTCGCDDACEAFGDCCNDACNVCGECCGDGICQDGENRCNCLADCASDPEVCCGDGLCDAIYESPCVCPSDCPNDPNGCEACECGGFGGNCSCSDNCIVLGGCCANSCAVCGQCCGDGICDANETPCNCPSDCSDPNACEPCECGFLSQNCGCDDQCVTFGDCCGNACGVCGFC